jgi:hypothetical protein
MNTFLKILLIAVLLVVAIKLGPVIFFGALVGLLAAAVLGIVGISLIAALLAIVIALVVALAPIWIPVLAIMGIVSLCRRNGHTPPAVAA